MYWFRWLYDWWCSWKDSEFWNKNRKRGLAGFVALDAYQNGEVIGTRLPENIDETTYFDIYNTLGVKGDKKFIYRSDLTKMYPYPIFEGKSMLV